MYRQHMTSGVRYQWSNTNLYTRVNFRYLYLAYYADDTTLYDIGLDKDTVENNLQHSLNLLKMWCLENGMIINKDKTKLMFISSRQKRKCMKDNKLAIEYDNCDLQLTSCEKVLGVHIDDNLTWTNHFQHVSKRYRHAFGFCFR